MHAQVDGLGGVVSRYIAGVPPVILGVCEWLSHVVKKKWKVDEKKQEWDIFSCIYTRYQKEHSCIVACW